MSAKYPYYLLADSPEGIKREAEISGQVPPSPIPGTEGDIRKGFVYKRVPHVTLGSIANNPDIREGMSREEIDAAIARYADSETLFDQPYEDKKRIRVTGPFTVESLSPHRAISEEDDQTGAEARAQESSNGQFETTILENLKRAGVQNTVKEERLTFDRLEPYAGTWIHAEGDYTENGSVKSVGVCIGPQHGTVDSRLVQDAAKGAIGVFDLLVVCGMAFDPHVDEEAKRFPNLNIILPRINADLSMGDELLKKTGAGNHFTAFGEPDIDIRTANGNGKLEVEIRGLDIYDPLPSTSTRTFSPTWETPPLAPWTPRLGSRVGVVVGVVGLRRKTGALSFLAGFAGNFRARLEGFDPPTRGLGNRCSIP